jgi:hypothetical protein
MRNEIEDFRLPDIPPSPCSDEHLQNYAYPEYPDSGLVLMQHVRQTNTKTFDLDSGLPCDLAAEKTILGAILLDNAYYREAAERLEPDDFSLDSHRRIFLRMGDLVAAGTAIDIVTLSYELLRNKERESVGGTAYLASLTEGLPRRLAIGDYIRITKDKSRARRLLLACSVVTGRLVDGEEKSLEVAGSLQELLSGIMAEAIWRRPEEILVSAVDYASDTPKSVNWLVEGIIQRGGNGIIAADGKTGKSLLAIHLALHLATGTDWLGLPIPIPVQTALISREDDPGETARRIGSFVSGCGYQLRNLNSLEDWFWISTRAQMPTFLLENKKEVREIIEALKYRKVEVAFFDVFRSLWTGDENDAQEVSRMLEVLRAIQREVGCAVVLLHHLNKGEVVNPFQKIRGSSAIQGWLEWGFGISILNQEEDESQWIRQIRFQTKAARAHSRMCYRICGPEEAMRIELADPVRNMAPEKNTTTPSKRKKVTDIVQPSAGRERADLDN